MALRDKMASRTQTGGGAADPKAPVRVIDGGMTFGVLAMDAYVFG